VASVSNPYVWFGRLDSIWRIGATANLDIHPAPKSYEIHTPSIRSIPFELMSDSLPPTKKICHRDRILPKLLAFALFACSFSNLSGANTNKPTLYGRHWIAITGKPLGATAGAKIFDRGGNAVDAACAMLAAVCTMYDDLSWGGETQALIFDPRTSQVRGINALGVAPTGATPEFFSNRGDIYPPGKGPLAAVTPGTPGGIFVMLAEFGTMSLAEVLEPAMQLADGYPIEANMANRMEREKEDLKQWPYSKELFLPHLGESREAPYPGEIFRQPTLLSTLEKLLETEAAALRDGKNRAEAIHAAYDRFYRGDIAEEFVRSSREMGGLHTLEDLTNWKVHIEDSVSTHYKGIDVHKLTSWVQGPVLLQCLNLLEPIDLPVLGYNSARYIHTLYQVMNLAFADRDFYYGDPYFPPKEPIEGLLSKAYARARSKEIDWHQNDPWVGPGDPYPYQNDKNPFAELRMNWRQTAAIISPSSSSLVQTKHQRGFLAGTTSIQAADKAGWVVSITPSGGWLPACIAGHTGIGMSQRMQSFVLDPGENPYNVVAPGKRPRATLTPSLALKNGRPFLSFAVQGGDTQDQNLLQFFLNIVEFDMNVQEASEAPNINSYQMRSSFEEHRGIPGKLVVSEDIPSWVRKDLRSRGYHLFYQRKTSGPITAIYFDQAQQTFQGAASDHGDDYGIVW
jgi:gamma-glutamyltranspeptidase / glutathione hydrolase